MAKYIVGIREVHVSIREIEANSVKQALKEVGEVEEMILEYSHTLDSNTWSIEKINNEGKLKEISHNGHEELDFG